MLELFDKPASWDNLEEYADDVAAFYRKNLWQNQEVHLEIMVEKDSMASTLEVVTEDLNVGLNVLRGDSSETFLWEMGRQLEPVQKSIKIYCLGDYDPKGAFHRKRLPQTINRIPGR